MRAISGCSAHAEAECAPWGVARVQCWRPRGRLPPSHQRVQADTAEDGLGESGLKG